MTSKRFENSFSGFSGNEIYYQYWLTENPSGTIVVTHGLAEHSDCYNEFAEKLNSFGWNTVAWDLRGHGRSQGKRGYVNAFDDYVEDFKALLKEIKSKDFLNTDLVYFGHSMGGLITLKSKIMHEDLDPLALCLSAPALGLAIEVPKLKQKFAEIGGDWFPRVTLKNEINYFDLVRDEDLAQSYETDTLRHDKISPRVFLGMIDGFKYCLKNAEKLNLPVFFQLAGNDKIVSTPEAKKFFAKIPFKSKVLNMYNDSYHEVFNDLDKNQAFGDLKNFLDGLKGS